MSDKRVTVIIPTHNRASLLRRAVESVKAQTHKHWQAIIVADNCTDNTSEILDECRNDRRFKIVELKSDSGGAKARNVGMDMVDTDYVAFLDDDDYWLPEKLALQLKAFEENPDVCIISCRHCFHNKQPPKTEHKGWKRLSLEDVLVRNEIGSFSFCMTKMEYLRRIRIDKELKSSQDWELWIKMMMSTGKKACILNDVLTVYDNSHTYGRLTTDYENALESYLKMIREFEGDMTPEQTALHMAFYHNRKSCISPDGFFKNYGLSLKNMAASIKILTPREIAALILVPFVWKIKQFLRIRQ